MQDNSEDVIIRLEHVTKRFGGVTALSDVSFSIRRGEIHAVLGENGAGKSTLMKLLAGVQEPDSGRIWINGRVVRITSPRAAEALGISMVFQELNLFPTLSVTANLFIGNELRRGGMLLNERAMREQAQRVLDTLSVDLDPTAKVGSLRVGQKQIVEIARAIHQGTSAVIMDEPNSALNEHETKALFSIIRRLKSQGITILYVSHRLEEVFAISDRITVLRDGHYIGTWKTAETTIEETVTNVVGRQLGEMFPPVASIPVDREVALSVDGMRIGSGDSPISFQVRRGEILGFAGLEGSGVQDVLTGLFGLSDKRNRDGEVWFNGRKLDARTPPALIQQGWAFIPANRREEGLMLEWPILRNVSLAIIGRLANKLKLIKQGQEREVSTTYIEQLNIATDSLEKKVLNLSGGNQQKVVLAKWLATRPSLIILNDPTRGIDVGTKRDIYSLIRGWAEQGYTILFTSSEIEEILGLCNRVLVFYKGRIVHQVEAADTNKEEIMRYVLGGANVEENNEVVGQTGKHSVTH